MVSKKDDGNKLPKPPANQPPINQEEQIALEKYVDAVGGWERAKTVIEQCLKQKF